VDDNGTLIIPDTKRYILPKEIIHPKLVKNVCFHSNIKHIYERAFAGCSNLRSITFESKVNVCDQSLMKCHIENVCLNSMCSDISGHTWLPDFSTLKEITFGENIKELLIGQFDKCKESLSLPKKS